MNRLHAVHLDFRHHFHYKYGDLICIDDKALNAYNYDSIHLESGDDTPMVLLWLYKGFIENDSAENAA